MTRVTATFLTLLFVGTLALGIAWQQVDGLVAGSGNAEGTVLLVVSGSLLVLTLLSLGRILYATTRTKTALSQSEQETRHA